MVDVTYGIPLEIRDAALKMAGLPNAYAVESSTRNREVKAIMADKLEAKATKQEDSEEKIAKARAILETLATKLASSKRKPSKEKAIEVSNKDVTKLVTKLPFNDPISAPSDSSVKSFFVFGFAPEMPQYILTNFCSEFGPVALTKVVHRARCAYVTFGTRKSAEEFANAVINSGLTKTSKSPGLVVLDGKYPIRVAWGAPKPLGTTNDEHNKLGMVVMKVMKQLAERETAPVQKRKKTEKTKTYKAAGADVEI